MIVRICQIKGEEGVGYKVVDLSCPYRPCDYQGEDRESWKEHVANHASRQVFDICHHKCQHITFLNSSSNEFEKLWSPWAAPTAPAISREKTGSLGRSTLQLTNRDRFFVIYLSLQILIYRFSKFIFKARMGSNNGVVEVVPAEVVLFMSKKLEWPWWERGAQKKSQSRFWTKTGPAK